MTSVAGEIVVVRKAGGLEVGDWSLDGEDLIVRLKEQVFHISSDGDLDRAVKAQLPSITEAIFGEKMELKACCNCKYFQMSGMARDMGRGQRGVCTFHKIGVEICHLCEDFTKVS